MSKPDLVVRQDDLHAMAGTLRAAREEMRRDLADMRSSTESSMHGWLDSSRSRPAQRDFDRRLGVEHEKLLAALEKVERTINDIADAAHEAEVRCVAILS